ncbi:type I-E CRISPR-associated protein Cse1/CasA [Acetobacteraceae bacterium B3987]|nr:type I-E CRISPR-associated protein Cse1/CasA [Acetobacteraceae bacterium B3987]
MNLITDPWIPVQCANGEKRVIAPWQMAEADVLFPDWFRADLNIACLELLIGLIYMADPPEDTRAWHERKKPDPERLKARLAPFAPAFFLLGDGPRFLQDQEKLEGAPNPVDMLFIDSAGGQTKRNNIDVMVHRDRYESLPLPEAAMALYTLQDFAPSGGAGNRTSMRGGGPLVTIVDPGKALWDLIWMNVPFGSPSEMKDLPWMKPTRTSEKGQIVQPPDPVKGFGVEAFFGMPRRLRLVGDGEKVTGVIQKPYGANYAQWRHPLSPYYRLKPGSELLPRHPRAGRFGYRNWLGVVAVKPDRHQKEQGLAELALTLREWRRGKRGERDPEQEPSVIVAGWAMNNMSPRDFICSRQPIQCLSDDEMEQLTVLIEAAHVVADMLNRALIPLLSVGEAREAQREEFYVKTESEFYSCFRKIICPHEDDEDVLSIIWLKALRRQVWAQFDPLALSGLADRTMQEMKKITEARRVLGLELRGYGKAGALLFETLDLPLPKKKKERKAT